MSLINIVNNIKKDYPDDPDTQKVITEVQGHVNNLIGDYRDRSATSIQEANVNDRLLSEQLILTATIFVALIGAIFEKLDRQKCLTVVALILLLFSIGLGCWVTHSNKKFFIHWAKQWDQVVLTINELKYNSFKDLNQKIDRMLAEQPHGTNNWPIGLQAVTLLIAGLLLIIALII